MPKARGSVLSVAVLAVWLAAGGVAPATAQVDREEALRQAEERARADRIRDMMDRAGAMVGLGPAADEPRPFPEPPLAGAIKKLLELPYLTADERLEIRIRHGAWEEADLAASAERARAALARGAYVDPSFNDESVPAVLRARGALERGEPERALELAGEDASAAGVLVRGRALMDLGRFDEAVEVLSLARGDIADAKDIDARVDVVRAKLLLARLTPLDGPAMAAYSGLVSELGRLRSEVDPTAWEPRLAEAEVLVDKDNYPEAGQALSEALTYNPRSARAWMLLGRLAVDQLDLDRAESIALRLERLSSPYPSAEAAILRAAARNRATDAKGAIEALEPAVAVYPGRRDLLAARAAALAGMFDFDAADAAIAEFETLAPGSADAYLAAGAALADARQYEKAAEYLREASARAPHWARPVMELGLSQMQAGDDADALRALTRATELDPFNVRVANGRTLLEELRTYSTFETEHFIVRCKPGVDELVAREMLAPLEAIHARVAGSEPGGIDHTPAKKTTIELYPNHRWFAVRIVGMPGVHTIAAATGPVIAMEAPRAGPGHLVGPYDWPRVVQHEYTHTVTLSRTNNRLPHWFTEAAAVYLEDSPVGYDAVRLLTQAYDNDALFDFAEINLAFARPKKPTDRSQAYAQGHWMYTYIIERWGSDAPLQLMDLYAQGVREEAAFERVLGQDRDAFFAGFKAWAGEQLIAWGMHPADGVPRLKELAKQAGGPVGAVQVAEWLDLYPEHPEVLERAVSDAIEENGGRPSIAMAPLLRRYASARPVDPLPHKLLADLALSGAEGMSATEAIAHLEYLDAREQYTAVYALELSRQYAAAGDMTKAAEKAERTTRIAPYDARTREHAATIALRMKDYATAERHLAALAALEPDREIHRKRLEALERLKAG